MEDFIKSILDRLAQYFDAETLLGVLAGGVANLLVGLAVYGAFVVVWRILKLVVMSGLKRGRVDETTTSFIMTLLKYSLLTIGLLSALEAAGIRTSAVLASLGIAGLTIGFAARDALSNLISGILIFIDRPFVIGDLVEVGEYYGRVERIKLRSTRIVTVEGKMLAVPNSIMINETVASYTNFPHLRLDVGVTIGPKEDIMSVRRILLELVKTDEDFMEEPAPRVVVTELNDYNIRLEMQVWLREVRQHIEKRFYLREDIFNTLNLNGIEMPLETIQIEPLQVNLEKDLFNHHEQEAP